MPSNEIRILFFGDIVGPLGREAVRRYIQTYKEKKKIDFIIANGENASHGSGLNYNHYKELLTYGINIITNGNHIFNSKDSLNPNLDFEFAIRPINIDSSVPGKGYILVNYSNNIKICVYNALGRVFIPLAQTSPFYDLDSIIGANLDAINIIDFHAEATAEKRVCAEYFDGRVCAVIGTHTHVQTNDPKILNKGTFFLTDAGMNGAYDSVLGIEKEGSMVKTITGKPYSFNIARTGKMICNGVIMKINTKTKKVTNFELVNETFEY